MSRGSIVAMLIAAELVVVSLAIYSLGGGMTLAGGMHRVEFTPAAIAPLAAGTTPQIVIDDSRSRVRVGVSSDALVHVRDLTEMRGAIFSSGTYPQLRMTRTADGVRIERPWSPRIAFDLFGFSTQAIEVNVPSGAHVEIARCEGADVTGITGGVSVRSQDGHITLADLDGNVDARSDDGYLDARNVRGDRLAIESHDGHLALHDVAVGSLLATTRDGRIEAQGLSLVGERPDATLHTGDGSIKMYLSPNANLTVDASTGDGRIDVDGSAARGDGSTQRTVRLGTGAGRMTVDTADGSIHILTNGAPQSD
ncbi:MAG: DUF4097 family beta strand repeat protein [Candidatus Eremiobacteraeota bacterium]|nr:DUF4097 family beta strand repeat protein [Candidatus Eremiobacteraeota bacterium]